MKSKVFSESFSRAWDTVDTHSIFESCSFAKGSKERAHVCAFQRVLGRLLRSWQIRRLLSPSVGPDWQADELIEAVDAVGTKPDELSCSEAVKRQLVVRRPHIELEHNPEILAGAGGSEQGSGHRPSSLKGRGEERSYRLYFETLIIL